MKANGETVKLKKEIGKEAFVFLFFFRCAIFYCDPSMWISSGFKLESVSKYSIL